MGGHPGRPSGRGGNSTESQRRKRKGKGIKDGGLEYSLVFPVGCLGVRSGGGITWDQGQEQDRPDPVYPGIGVDMESFSWVGGNRELLADSRNRNEMDI